MVSVGRFSKEIWEPCSRGGGGGRRKKTNPLCVWRKIMLGQRSSGGGKSCEVGQKRM